MILRPATPEDAAPLARILTDWVARTSWMPKLHGPDEDLRFLRSLIDRAEVILAEGARGPEGYIARDDAQILQLYLAPEARGQGTGAALLRAMQEGRDALWLWCFQANSGARRFYERQGFTLTRTTQGADNEERLPDARYDWRRR